MKSEIATLLEKLTSPSYAWGPATTFGQLKAMTELLARRRIGLHGKTCVDFGCGAIRPLSIASVMYLLGADNTLGVDTTPPIDDAQVAIGLYALLLAVLSGRIGTDTTRLGVSPRVLRERCAAFDLARLLNGDLRGVPPSIRQTTGDYLDLAGAERGFDFLTSYSVLEHVRDIAAYLRAFRASVSADGAVFAAIDYRDHRQYTVGASQWLYLMDDGDHEPGYINKVRHSELVRLVGEAGFAIAESHIVRQEPSRQELEAFLPRYYNLSRDDITITEAHLLLTPI